MPHAGQIIKQRRNELGLTQRQLALLLGVAQSAVSYLEKAPSISSDRIPAIAKALELTTEAFALKLIRAEAA